MTESWVSKAIGHPVAFNPHKQKDIYLDVRKEFTSTKRGTSIALVYDMTLIFDPKIDNIPT